MWANSWQPGVVGLLELSVSLRQEYFISLDLTFIVYDEETEIDEFVPFSF